jgi:hypothetical protein
MNSEAGHTPHRTPVRLARLTASRTAPCKQPVETKALMQKRRH